MAWKADLRQTAFCTFVALFLTTPLHAYESGAPATIRSQADFDAYVRGHAGKPTPLDTLSPGARERFLLDLNFGRGGLNGFNPENLAYDLTQPDIDALLALFGMQEYAPKSRLRDESMRPPRQIGPFERRYNAFYRKMRQAPPGDADEYASAIVRAFDEELSGTYDAATLSGLDDHDLSLAYRAARAAADQAPRSQRADAYMKTYAEMEQRKLAIADDALETRDLLLSARRFDEARAFAATHADAELPPLPEFRDRLENASGAATVWQLSDDGSTLARTEVDLEPLQILVTAGCHFSEDAAQDISSDPVLGPAFAKHARWLVNSPGREDIEAAKAWNRRFPSAQVEMIHDPAEWTIFPNWSMPAFYIVRDGKVLASLRGWAKDPPEQFRQPLIDALRAHGLLEAGDAKHK